MHRTCRAESRPSAAPNVPVNEGREGSLYHIDVEGILLANRPTLHFIPRRCRPLWNTVLSRALAAVVVASSPGARQRPEHRDLAWAELLCLAKAVLTPAPRAGRKHPKCQENHTRCLLQRWLDGDRRSLYADACRPLPRRRQNNNNREARIALGTSLVENGKDSQACKALTSHGLAPDTVATRSSLEAKHPLGMPVPPELVQAPALFDRVREKDVLDALRAFAKGSAPGPSGLRAQHLLDAVSSPEQGSTLQALADVVNLLAAGLAPRDLSQHMAGASLIALSKENADIRPIAVGEVLRRLTSKCLCSSVKAAARDMFEPLQVGVACPQGLEAAIHTLGQHMERHATSSTKLVLTIDFQNAFNTVSRTAFLRACRQHMPAVASWASWCYSLPSRLVYNGRVINSNAGVQQGDNLGPLLFSLALHPALQRLKAVPGIDVVIGYLDDVVIAGDAEAVGAALGILQATLPDLALGLNASKCELIPTAGSNSEVDLTAFPSGMRRVPDACFKFLGTPIGTRAFVERFTQEKRTDKAAKLLEEIVWIEDGQIAHKLLMRCMGASRVMHAMRTTRPDWIMPQLKSVDDAVMNSLESCLGLALPQSARLQASLPTRLGGLGLRSAERHAAAAFLTSRLATKELCCAMGPHFQWHARGAENALAAAAALCNDTLPQAERVSLEALMGAPLGQKELSQRLDKALHDSLLSSSSEALRARLRAVSAPHAGAWLTALPSENLDQRMKHAEFVAAVKLWLCLPFLHTDCWCPKCDQVLDRLCAHAGRRGQVA